MSIITIYPTITNVAGGDLLVISDISMEGNPTRTVSVGQLSAFIGGGGGTGLVDSINTTNGTFISLTPIVQTTGDVVVTADLSATGTKDNTTFLRGDNTWAVPAIGSVSSVGLTETGNALTITNSPITGSGNINIAGAGTASQVVLGNLNLGTYTTGTLTDVNFTNNITAFAVAETVGAGTIDFVLSVTGGAAGQFLQQDGTWATPSGGGAVTSIIAGTGATISATGAGGTGDVTINADVTDISASLPISVSAATGSVNISVDLATTATPGVVGIPYSTVQAVAVTTPTAVALRSYPIQFNSSDQLVVNVPWTSGTASVVATSALLGLVKLYTNTVPTETVKAVSDVASRTYGIQLNASSQMVVNVPWTNSTSGATTILPTTLTVSNNQTVDLGTNTYVNSQMIVLSWVGGNGTAILTLPAAASSTNRLIRFISDSDYGAGTRNADITPAGTDVIDGAASAYRINKSYEGVQLWSNGTEWFIIQKKA